MPTIIERLRAEIDERNAKIKEIQRECSHPLAALETKNEGSSGNWDRKDSYWTNHHCTLCDRQWATGQDWNRTGDKNGMPMDDPRRKVSV